MCVSNRFWVGLAVGIPLGLMMWLIVGGLVWLAVEAAAR